MRQSRQPYCANRRCHHRDRRGDIKIVFASDKEQNTNDSEQGCPRGPKGNGTHALFPLKNKIDGDDGKKRANRLYCHHNFPRLGAVYKINCHKICRQRDNTKQRPKPDDPGGYFTDIVWILGNFSGAVIIRAKDNEQCKIGDKSHPETYYAIALWPERSGNPGRRHEASNHRYGLSDSERAYIVKDTSAAVFSGRHCVRLSCFVFACGHLISAVCNVVRSKRDDIYLPNC